MAAEALTDAQVVATNGSNYVVDGNDVAIVSKNEYGEGFSKFIDSSLGTPDVRIYGNQLTGKIMQVSMIVGSFIGNMWAVRSMRMRKPAGFLGLSL